MGAEKRINKSRELKYNLYREIRRNQWAAHHQLPSERILAKQFGINVNTVRKAFREMAMEGAIYQVERVGNFVSPGIRLGQILLVTPPYWDFHLMEFFRAFTNEIRRMNESVLPILIAREDFFVHLEEIESFFREVTFVVFFRSAEDFAKARPILQKKEIPHCYYGSDRGAGLVGDSNRMMFQEKKIVRMAFQRLRSQGGGPLGCVYATDVPITQYRYSIFREICAEEKVALADPLVLEVVNGRDIWGESRLGSYHEDGNWNVIASRREDRSRTERFLRKVVKKGASLFLPTDGFAMRIQQAANELGLRIPEDLRTVSVDNMDFSEYLLCPLTTIEIGVYRDAQRLLHRILEFTRERGPIFEMESELRLVERRSG